MLERARFNERIVKLIDEYRTKDMKSPTLHSGEYYDSVVKTLRKCYYSTLDELPQKLATMKEDASERLEAKRKDVHVYLGDSDEWGKAMDDACIMGKCDGIIFGCRMVERIMDELKAER